MPLEHGLHIMLSYHWDNKELVSKIYKVLKSKGIPVWMDIHGGISFNLFQSMADGVENAAAVCCFMTPKYQNSRNCEKELLYAERRRVSIIPCRLIRDWEPSNWLGIVTAGLVFVDLRDTTDVNFDLKMEKLLSQIRIVTEKKLNCFQPDTPSVNPTTLYPVLSQIDDQSNNTIAIDSKNIVRSASMYSTPESSQRMTSTLSCQLQSVNNVNTVPPPVPPRPDKSLVRDRLSQADSKKDVNETKENLLCSQTNLKHDICESQQSVQQQQTHVRSVPDALDILTPVTISERKRGSIIIDYSKFSRSPRIIGDENDAVSFCCPSGVAVSKTGLIYVADQQNQRVQVIPLLRSDKQILSRSFNRPKDIHVDDHGRILVTEHNRLLILDNELNILKSIGGHGSKSSEFNVPWGVTTDSLSNIYVCDQMNNRIQKFDADGHFLLEWGYEGDHPGQFYFPHFISIAGNRVAISDQLNHRIQVFDCFGNYHYKIGGGSSSEPGRFSCPFGVCIDGNGHVIVADHDNNRVQFFDENGDVRLVLDKQANPIFDFQGVHGLALTHDGGLLITDYKRDGKHRLFIFA